MTFRIEKIAYGPTSKFDDIENVTDCEILFITSGHGEVPIRVGSVKEEPKHYREHMWEAAKILMQKHPEYAGAVCQTWKLHDLKPVEEPVFSQED